MTFGSANKVIVELYSMGRLKALGDYENFVVSILYFDNEGYILSLSDYLKTTKYVSES